VFGNKLHQLIKESLGKIHDLQQVVLVGKKIHAKILTESFVDSQEYSPLLDRSQGLCCPYCRSFSCHDLALIGIHMRVCGKKAKLSDAALRTSADEAAPSFVVVAVLFLLELR
jgi:hypothetical protein